jgi:tripartite-type tricarboxylate transporter receptor subunit TctC
MKLARRTFLQSAGAAVAAPAFSCVATAQTYPTRPITMIVPLAAGGVTDVLGRLLAERMRQSLGQPIIVENISGADGSIATARVARARPDGYTIELGFKGAHVLDAALYSRPCDVLNDFAPVSLLTANADGIFARKTMPAKDLNEMIGWLKANPNKASAGIAASSFRLLPNSFRKKPGRILPSCRTVALPPQSKTWWPARSICSSAPIRMG